MVRQLTSRQDHLSTDPVLRPIAAWQVKIENKDADLLKEKVHPTFNQFFSLPTIKWMGSNGE